MYVVALGRLVPLRHWQCQPNGEPSRIEGVTRARAKGHGRRPTTNGVARKPEGGSDHLTCQEPQIQRRIT